MDAKEWASLQVGDVLIPTQNFGTMERSTVIGKAQARSDKKLRWLIETVVTVRHETSEASLYKKASTEAERNGKMD